MRDSVARRLAEAEAAFRSRDLARAGHLLKRILVAAPASSGAHELLAYVEGERGNLDRVFEHLDQATRLPGATATAWYYLGVWYRKAGRNADAVAAFHHALAINARLFPAAHDLGLTHSDLRDHSAALEAFDVARAIDPSAYEVLHNRGRELHALGRFEEALASYDEALAQRPQAVPTLINRGEVLNDLRCHAEALECYHRAAALSPGNPDAEWNESLTRLLLGDFEAGWRMYEARWKGPAAWPRRHSQMTPLPSLEAAAGRTVLVWCEQGLGDTLHFCRYVPLLAARGARVVFEVQPELKGLLSRLGGCEVLGLGEGLPACDYQVPLLSLPRVFGTTLDTIPATVPYLKAHPDRVAEWGRRLGAPGKGIRIGIACTGSTVQKDNRYRSMALRDMLPLQDEAELFLVQPTVTGEDEGLLRAPGCTVRSLAGEIRDFEDTAGILANLELVVTVDTSLAHLAGAVGKPVWILLPWTPTWRWLVDRDDSPWYGTARLFRQQERGRWDAVILRVREALRRRSSTGSSATS